MSKRMTARRARFALAMCLVALPAWHALAPSGLRADRAAAHELMRSATELFGPQDYSASGKKMGRPVPLGLRN